MKVPSPCWHGHYQTVHFFVIVCETLCEVLILRFSLACTCTVLSQARLTRIRGFDFVSMRDRQLTSTGIPGLTSLICPGLSRKRKNKNQQVDNGDDPNNKDSKIDNTLSRKLHAILARLRIIIPSTRTSLLFRWNQYYLMLDNVTGGRSLRIG